jgi:hypothetical protein
MDARQATLWRAAIKYGWSYARVEPAELNGEHVPKITPYSPKQVTSLYEDPINDEWAAYAMITKRPPKFEGVPSGTGTPNAADGQVMILLDRWRSYKLKSKGGRWHLVETVSHRLGVVPVVRFLDEQASDDDADVVSCGKVEPLIPIQQQVNQISYQLAMALQYGAFRQRYATGMTVEKDANNNVISPFNAAVDMVWFNREPGAKFGEFSQTDISGYLDARDKLLLFVASTAPVPPHNMVVGNAISNIAAEALVALESRRRADTRDHQYTFGEGAEQLMRLSGLASNDIEAWNDMRAEVRWADTTPRSFAEIADAMVKLKDLEIPVHRLWEYLPNVTDKQLAEWRRERDERQSSRMEEMRGLLAEQEQLAAVSPPQIGQDGSEDEEPPSAA